MSVTIRTSQNVLLEYQPASVGERILGAVIDYAVIFGWLLIMGVAFSSTGRSNTFFVIIFFLPIVFYDLLSEWFLNGQSVGKIAMNMRVVMLDGSQPGLGAYLLRWLLRMVESVAFLGGIVPIITVAANGKGQRLGDLAAGTSVVRLKPAVLLDDVLRQPQPENYVVQFPDVRLLSDRDMSLIQNIVQQGDETALMLTADKVKTVMSVETNLSNRAFLETVIHDYQFITAQ